MPNPARGRVAPHRPQPRRLRGGAWRARATPRQSYVAELTAARASCSATSRPQPSEHETIVKEHLHTLVQPTEWKLGALQAAAWQDGALHLRPARRRSRSAADATSLHQNGAPLLTAPADRRRDQQQRDRRPGIERRRRRPAGRCSTARSRSWRKPDARVRFVDVQRLGSNGVVCLLDHPRPTSNAAPSLTRR